MKLLAMRGISGSGKSTYVETLKQQGWAVVSRDNIRETVFKDYQSVDEDAVTAIQDNMIGVLLKAGRNVCVDDTNIRVKYLRRFAEIAAKHNAEFDVKTIHCDIDEAIRRVQARAAAGGRDVPEGVIRKQAQGLKSSKLDMNELYTPTWQPYIPNPDLPRAIIFDLDNTLAHNNGHRSPYDYTRVLDDELVESVADTISRYDDVVRIAMSGREETCRADTEQWLRYHGVHFDHLFMRREGDGRKDSIVKYELFDENVRGVYDILFIMDDRVQVCQMWRSIGLKVYQVEFGDF